MTKRIALPPRQPWWWRIVRATICGAVVAYFAGYQFWNLVHLAYGPAAAWTFVLTTWVGFPLAYRAGRTDVASWWCRGCSDRDAVIAYLERERDSLARTVLWWRGHERTDGNAGDR
jgi:1-acyl-sn-glycerol-3-phosphate acyltransferase